MSALLNRSWKLNIESLVTEQLRVVFQVTKTLEKEPNTMNISVYNLSDGSRSLLDEKMKVVLEAGYKNVDAGTDTRAIIFSGLSRTCDHLHETADWETKIHCGDGEQLFHTARAVKSFAAGAQLSQAIRYVADQLKVNIGNLNEALNDGGLPFEKFEHGLAVNGSAVDVFNTLMKTAGYNWSVQQGALQIIKKGDQLVEEAVVLSKDTGLIGSPEHSHPHKNKKPSFLVARSLLNPKIRPGCTVRMNALQVKGDFIVHKVVHSGDSHGNDWTSKFEALASNKQTTDVF